MAVINEKLLARIIEKTKDSDLLEALTNKLSLPDLQSLLLEVYRLKSEKIDTNHLFSQYKSNRFTKPSSIEFEKYLDFEKLAISLLPYGYKNIELSPVSPLGSCSVLAPVEQNNILTTIRNTEVCSDPTNVLAMECARKRELLLPIKDRKFEEVKLSTVNRVLRTQPFDGKDSVAHFKILSLCSGGRDSGSFTFEFDNLKEQLNYFVLLLNHLSTISIHVSGIRIYLIVYNMNIKNKLRDISDEILTENDNVKIDIDVFTGEQSYYETLRYNIFATNYRGEEFFVCDGGFTDWTKQLLNNGKERFLTSGMGVERLFLVF